MRPLGEISKQTHVRVVFADRVAFFDLPPRMTLDDLSKWIAGLDEDHVGGPIRIDVQKGAKAAWVPWPIPPNEKQRGKAASQ